MPKVSIESIEDAIDRDVATARSEGRKEGLQEARRILDEIRLTNSTAAALTPFQAFAMVKSMADRELVRALIEQEEQE